MASILLVDDQRLFAENMRIVLESRMPGLTICGIASNGREAIDMVEAYRPDLVLMDVRMPVMDGVEATREIRRSYPETKILMLTTFSNDEYVLHAMQYGAAGYILKDIPPEELFSSITAVLNGAVLVSPAVMARLLNRTDETTAQDEIPDRGQVVASLSEREKEIIRLISLAHTNREIGDILFMAEQTVKNHLTEIYRKLGVTRRTELMRMVTELGLGVEQNKPPG